MLNVDDIRWTKLAGGYRVYGIAATIELAREHQGNPPVPAWLKDAYEESVSELAQIGLVELHRATDTETVRVILAVITLWKGPRTYARILLEFSEDEVLELEEQAFGK